jgi:hypothetical protein
MVGYWKPIVSGIGNAGASISNALQAPQTPVELPEVGTKMLLVIHPYGGVSVVDGDNLVGGMDVVEVEVTAIKKSKTTLE